MSFIAREDGEHFVIPSYRDVLAGRSSSQLKKDILSLSHSYGEYITLQKKGSVAEVAFSPDTGYLLGETVWQHFDRPMEMVYCEIIPNTTDAILVVVKDGGVYLDGSFPVEAVQEELVIFLTQQNSFEIYIHGDVPISKTPADGKFCFEATSVKKFTVLDGPVFPTLPLVKEYHLELVETVLQKQGIGALPIKPVLIGIIVLGLGYFLWTLYANQAPPPPPPTQQVNPYQGFYDSMNSPAPEIEINKLVEKVKLLQSIPGWSVKDLSYSKGSINAKVYSDGGTVRGLFDWAKSNDASFSFASDGVSLSTSITVPNRDAPKVIYPIKDLMVTLIDRFRLVLPGNPMTVAIKSLGAYSDVPITLNFNGIAIPILLLISDQLKDLPIVLQSVSLSIDTGLLSGSIHFDVLGK